MCYNKEVSLVVFIFTISTVVKILKEYKINTNINYLFAGIFILSIGLMQLIEFFLHLFREKNLDISGKLVKFMNFLLPVVIILQFAVSEIYLHYTNKIPKKMFILDFLAYGLFIYLMYKVFRINRSYENKISCNFYNMGCRMNWDVGRYMKNESYIMVSIFFIIYFLYLSMMSYYIFKFKYFIILVLISFIFLILPNIISIFTMYKINGSGSLWCLFSVILICMITMEKDAINL